MKKFRVLIVLMATVLSLAPSFSVAAQDSPPAGLYPLKNQPTHLAVSDDGSVWFTETGIAVIGQLKPDGQIRTYPLPRADARPEFIASTHDGTVWFTEAGHIGRISTDGKIAEYPFDGGASGLVAAADGNVWVALGRGGVAKIRPEGTLTVYKGCSKCDVYGMALGHDGALWLAEDHFSKERWLGRMTLTGSYSEVSVPGSGWGVGAPQQIIAGPDNAMWFTEKDHNKIAKLLPSGGFSEFDLPKFEEVRLQLGDIDSLAIGGDGSIWFAYSTNHLGKISATGIVTTFSTKSAYSGPRGIASGRNGLLWFAEPGTNKIASTTTDGTQQEYALPPGDQRASACSADPVTLVYFPTDGGTVKPNAITVTPNNSVWFIERGTGKIAVLDPATGAIQSFPVQEGADDEDAEMIGSQLHSIVHTADGRVWFSYGNAVAEITRSGHIHAYVVSPDRTKVSTRPGKCQDVWYR